LIDRIRKGADPIKMNDPVRCTILSPYVDQRGGAELSLLHALRQGEACGVAWSLAVPRDGHIPATARELGLPVTVYGESRTRDVFGYLRSISAIRSLLRSQRSQLLLSWDAHPHYRGFAAALAAGVPSAWFQKGGVGESFSARMHARLPTRAILANSGYTAERQSKLQKSVGRPRPIYVVPSAVDLEEFNAARLGTPAECRRELGLDDAKRWVVIVGRLQSWKGFHVLLEAVPNILAKTPNSAFLFVGGEHWSEPDYGAQLQRRAQELGVADAVRLPGFVPHDQIAKYMQAAEIVVHASVGEPFGIVVIEALALGKPTVAANEGGPTTVIRHELDGLLAAPTDATAIGSAVTRLLQDDQLANRLASSGQSRAQLFGIERFGRRLAHAVQAIVRRENGPGIMMDDELRLDAPSLPNR
jgi:hypothetical protein